MQDDRYPVDRMKKKIACKKSDVVHTCNTKKCDQRKRRINPLMLTAAKSS